MYAFKKIKINEDNKQGFVFVLAINECNYNNSFIEQYASQKVYMLHFTLSNSICMLHAYN